MGFVGVKVDAEQRARKNNGDLFHTVNCFGRGWED